MDRNQFHHLIHVESYPNPTLEHANPPLIELLSKYRTKWLVTESHDNHSRILLEIPIQLALNTVIFRIARPTEDRTDPSWIIGIDCPI